MLPVRAHSTNLRTAPHRGQTMRRAAALDSQRWTRWGNARRGVSPRDMYVNKWPRKTTSEPEAQGQGSSRSYAAAAASVGIQASKRGLRMDSAAPDKAQRADAERDPERRWLRRVARQSPPARIDVLYSLFIFCFYLPSSSFTFWPHSFILGVCVCLCVCAAIRSLCAELCVCLLASAAGVSRIG